MNTIIANRITIEDPSPDVIQWAKDNLKFANPEYEKKQRMGFWVGKTPKELRMYEWNGNKLVLPFGVIRELMPLLKDTLVYTRFRQNNVVNYGGDDVPLYDYQRTACQHMVLAKYGILKSKPGSGKTQMGIALIKHYKRRALWLCHTQDLLKQSMDRAKLYMNPELIGTITEGKVNVGVGVTFATVQTMANLDLEHFRDYWDVVIVDECHRVSASATTFTRYERVLNHLAARHKIGLSATPERSDGLIRATFALLGGIAYEVPDSAVADRTMKVKIRPMDVGFVEIDDDCLNDDGTINYTKLIESITTNEQRNKFIAFRIMENKGHSCLVLSDRLEQLKAIIAWLPEDMREDVAYVDGKMQSKKAKAEREQALEDMRTGRKKYLFSSYSLSREGLDIPRLDRLFLASPAKIIAVINHDVGRVQRTFEGKEIPVVYDFVDTNVGYCERAFKERKRIYRKIGAEIE